MEYHFLLFFMVFKKPLGLYSCIYLTKHDINVSDATETKCYEWLLDIFEMQCFLCADPGRTPLSWQNRIQIAIDVANALVMRRIMLTYAIML